MRLTNLRGLLLASCMAIFAISAQAQEEKLLLSLDKALEIAMDENPTIKVAEMDIIRAEYVVKEGQASLFPTLEASGGYTYNIALPVMFLPDGAFGPGTGGAMQMGFENGFNSAISGAVPLYMPAIYRNIAMSKEQLNMSVESARASKVNMTKEVKDAYYNALLAHKSLSVLLENKTILETNVSDIEKKFEQGMASEYDLLTAQVQLQNLLPNIEKSKSAVEISMFMIKVLLSLPQELVVDLTDDLEGLNSKITSVPSESKIDLSKNTDLSMLDFQIRLQEHQYKLSRANRLPQLVANYNLTTQSQSNDFKFGNYQWAQSSFVMLNLKIPIFAGFKNKYADLRIKTEMAKSHETRSYTESNLNMQVRSIISNIKSAREQILSSEVAIKQAAKAYSISQTRYNVGAGTILELNSSQVALMQSELNLNQAYYDLLKAYSEYSKVLGEEK